MDVREIYSPDRFSSQCLRLGLRPGFAADLNVPKANGEYWDLNREISEAINMSLLD